MMKKLIASGLILTTLLGTIPQISTLLKVNTNSLQNKNNKSQNFNNWQQLLTNENQQNNEKINWDTINIQLTSQFHYQQQHWQTLTSQLLRNDGKIVTAKDVTKALSLAQAKAQQYFEKFRNQVLTSQQLITALANDNCQFKNEYQKQQQKLMITNEKQNNHLLYNNHILKAVSNDMETLKNNIFNLKITRATLTTISAAAIAAASFWAVSWWFGISIPWATNCTLISIITGGIVAWISIAYACADEQVPGWEKATIVGFSTYTLGHIFEHILKPILWTANGTLTASSWAFPAILSIIPIISAILSWITLYN